VLIGVLGMGSLYFQVLRMPLMAAMLIASILLLTRAHHPKISAQNIRLTLLLTAALLLTSFVNPQNGIHINDIVIWLCNIGYVLVLQSCIGYRTYMRLYTKVMLAEAAISLISFVIGDLLSRQRILSDALFYLRLAEHPGFPPQCGYVQRAG